MPFQLSSHSYSFIDNCTHFAHHYLLKSCETDWSTIKSAISEEENEVASDKTFMRDWRGSCLKKLCFTSTENVPVSLLVRIGALFLCCAEVKTNNTEQKYDIAGALIHFRLLQKYFK